MTFDAASESILELHASKFHLSEYSAANLLSTAIEIVFRIFRRVEIYINMRNTAAQTVVKLITDVVYVWRKILHRIKDHVYNTRTAKIQVMKLKTMLMLETYLDISLL